MTTLENICKNNRREQCFRVMEFALRSYRMRFSVKQARFVHSFLKQERFEYSSAYWSDKQTYNPVGGRSGFDDVETKLPTYWSTSFKELCIGMKVEDDLRFLTIAYDSQSLYKLIADGKFRTTNIKRSKWKSLLAHSSLQSKCGRQGFNSNHRDKHQPSVRIGILGNQEDDCKTPDSFIGIGAKRHTPASQACKVEGTLPISGNHAACDADNGKKNIKSIGYILVR